MSDDNIKPIRPGINYSSSEEEKQLTPDPEVISLIQELLSYAEQGIITELVSVVGFEDGSVDRARAGDCGNPDAIIGSLYKGLTSYTMNEINLFIEMED